MRGSFYEHSDAVCTTVFGIDFLQEFSVQREHDHAHGMRLWLARLRANVGEWTIQSQARDYSWFRSTKKLDYIPILVNLENG